MRGPIISCVLLLLGCATKPDAAAQPADAEVRTVETCLVSAGRDHAAQRACVGRITDQCIESDDGNSTTPGMVACATSERAQWAALREGYVARLRATESASGNALLDAMLTEHAAWARARCAYAASYYEGGTLARVQGAMCMRDTEADLTLDLHGRLFDDS